MKTLKARAEAARRKFEEDKARLFRADGSQTYSDQEHAERLASLRSERNAVLREVEEETRAAFQEANAEITNLENRDPAELLASEELARANEKRGFASDAAETLNVEALKARLEAVLAGGDKGSIFAYWMAGQRRRERVLERRRESARSTADNPAAATQRISTATELDDVLDRMHQALDAGRTAAAIEATRTRIEAAQEAQQVAYLARHETNSVYNPNYAIPGR